MHPVPGRMRTLCAEKIAAKKSVFERLFFSACFRKRETRIWKRPLCIFIFIFIFIYIYLYLYIFICYRLFRSRKRIKYRVHGKMALNYN